MSYGDGKTSYVKDLKEMFPNEDFTSLDTFGIIPDYSSPRYQRPVEPNVGPLAEYLRGMSNDENNRLIEDANLRIGPIFGAMRADGEYRLSPATELPQKHMAKVISLVTGKSVIEVIPVSREGFVYPEWLPTVERRSFFEEAVLPAGDEDDSLAARLQLIDRRRYGLSLRKNVLKSMGDFRANGPTSIVEQLEELLCRFLHFSIMGDAARTSVLRPLIDRVHQAVPVRTVDDGRRWLVRVA